MDVLATVREEVERRRLLEPGTTIVVGVSGGVDSLCLLHVLNRLRPAFDWFIHVAHLNHCLRAAEADADMAFVVQQALDWALPCTTKVVDVATVAQQRGLSLEEAARQARYGFLAEVAQQVDASAVAVGHHADDQTETVLMHLLRGTGLAGLKGMSPKVDLASLRVIRDRSMSSSPGSRVQLVRPLLSVPRAEIEGYCRANHLLPRFDRSNLDMTYLRNRLRHELLPFLETYNPNIRALLRRTAEVASADHELLTELRDRAWAGLVREENANAMSFDLFGWRALPLAIQRAILREAAYRLCPELRDVDYVHIAQAIKIAAEGSTGAEATLPHGLRLTVDYRTLRLSTVGELSPVPDWPLLWQTEPVPVGAPGRTPLLSRRPSESAAAPAPNENSHRWRLDTTLWEGDRKAVLGNRDRWTAYLDADRLQPNLALRRRRPGDCFQPLGMDGQTIEVSDFMINAKIPRPWREHIPLLVHYRSEDSIAQEIAWLSGWRIDERVKVSAGTRRILRLQWSRAQTVST